MKIKLLILLNILAMNAFPQITKHPQSVTICEEANTSFAIETSAGTYKFRWQDSLTTGWQDIVKNSVFPNVTTKTLSLSKVPYAYHNTGFRCIVLSSDGSTKLDTSKSARLSIIGKIGQNTAIIKGKAKVCEYESNVVYSIATIEHATSYKWELKIDANIVSTDQNQITVDFKGKDYNTISVTPENSCFTGPTYSRYVQVIQEPEEFEIVKKLGAPMLISLDTTPNMRFIWSYRNKWTLEDYEVKNDTFRYAVYPESINLAKYEYWVTTAFLIDTLLTCSTMTYFDEPTSYHDMDPTMNEGLVVYPNPCRGSFYLITDAALGPPWQVMIKDSNGKILSVKSSEYTEPGGSLSLTIDDFKSGVYFVEVYFKDRTKMIRKLVKY